MTSIDFTTKMTYRRALFLPISITPLASAVQLLIFFFTMAILPLNIFLTAYFIDTALSVFHGDLHYQRILFPLMIMVLFQLHGCFTEPL